MAAAPMLRRVVLPCTVAQGKLSHKLESGCSPGFWVILDVWIPHPPGQEGLPWLSAGLLMGVVNGDKMKWFIKHCTNTEYYNDDHDDWMLWIQGLLQPEVLPGQNCVLYCSLRGNLMENRHSLEADVPLNLSPEQLAALELIRSQRILSLKKLLMLLWTDSNAVHINPIIIVSRTYHIRTLTIELFCHFFSHLGQHSCHPLSHVEF